MSKNTFDGSGGSILASIERDLTERATMLSNEAYPFLSGLMNSMGEQVNSTKIEWQDYTLGAVVSNINFGPGYVGGDTNIIVDDGTVFKAGMVIRAEDEQELMQVTSVSTNTITVVRGFAGTTAASALNDNTPLYVVTKGSKEGEAWVDDGNAASTQRFNYTQIFRAGFEVSGTLEAIRLAVSLDGSTNQRDIDVNRHIRRILREMAGGVIHGGAPASTPQGSSSVTRYMDGMVKMIRDGAAAGTGGIYTDISSVDFNDSATAYANLVSNLKAVWEAGGESSGRKALVVGSRIKEQLSVNVENGREQFGQRTIARNVQSFETPWGEYEIILDNFIAKDGMLVVDLDKIALRPQRGFTVEQMGKAGDSQRYMIVGEFTLQAEDAATGGHAYFYGAAA